MSRRNRFRVMVGVVLAGAMIGVAAIQLREANERSSEATARLAADSYLRALEAMRAVYTSEVVNRLPASVLVTDDYHSREGAVPLPATLTIALAERLGASIEGFGVRLFSEHPFPNRGKVEMDAFERLAMDSLNVAPTSVVSRVEGTGRDRVLRYARGDTMRAECVACHNTHPESPKRDWQVGDVRGVLAVSFPLVAFDESAREARSPYTTLLVLALLGLMGAIVILAGNAPGVASRSGRR